jgi:dimethylglycine dehydrogenase
MRWFNQHLMDGVHIEDISDAMAGFAVAGPKARDILQSVAELDLSSLKMMSCATVDLGLHRVKIARLSLSGELSYEINCTPSEHAALRKLLLEAGQKHGLKDVGFMAMLSMRLEKSIGIWNAEFTQSYTPAATGLDEWIAWDKGDFIGKEAAQNAPAPTQVQAMLEIDVTDADSMGFEPVWDGDTMVGMTTSGGYGHRLGRSFALSMIDADKAVIGTELQVHIMGELRTARMIEKSPYDASGAKMRA